MKSPRGLGLYELKFYSTLAYHNVIDPNRYTYRFNPTFELRLEDIDISSIPEDYFKALVKHVETLVIVNVKNDCLSPILNYASECKYLEIKDQYLDKRNTKEVVRAMESGSVQMLILNYADYEVDEDDEDDEEGEDYEDGEDDEDGEDYEDDVILDIKTLTQYNGMGTCSLIRIFNFNSSRYTKELKAWAKRINWGIKEAGDNNDPLIKNSISFIRSEQCVCGADIYLPFNTCTKC